ncbi:MAG: DUF3180 domain-containing protein [Candidatus Nanopelagicales bacterium]
MTPTRWRLIVTLAVVAAVLGWVVANLYELVAGRTLPVPILAAIFLVAIAVVLFIWTVLMRQRLRLKTGQEPVDPFVAARSAALAMASSRTGALVGGFYAGVAIEMLTLSDTEYGLERLWISITCVAASAALVFVAMWLETICRIKEEDDQP